MKPKPFEKSLCNKSALPVLAAMVVLCACSPPATTDAARGQPAVSAEQYERLQAMKTKGSDAALTVFPVRLAGQPNERVAEVVGTLLEKKGLRNIKPGKPAFKPADATDLETLASELGKFVRQNPIATEYALYAEFNGNRQAGLEELRAIVLDRSGAVVWTDRLTAKDEAIQKLKSLEPMSLCVLLVERLRPPFNLNEAAAQLAEPGKMSALLDERSGLPPEPERSPLPRRQQEMKKSLPKATLLIASVRFGGKPTDARNATDLATLVNSAKLCAAVPSAAPQAWKPAQPDSNELRLLWNLARDFRDQTKQHPPEADYVLCADYSFNPKNWEQGYVHFIVCDRQGEWVIVDMQNSHHPDYRSVKPASRADCDKLLVKRLEQYLR